MGIAQGSTPYIMVTIEGYDLTDANAIIVTFKTDSGTVDIDQTRVTATSNESESLLVVHLTQEETLALTPTQALLQVRWRDANDEAHTTAAARIDVASALYKGVI